MLDDNQRLRTAIQIAIDAHGMQLDKAGMLYMLHPLHVMDCVHGYPAKIVAVNHDVVEDTNRTLEELRNMVTSIDNTSSVYTDEEIDALDAITKRKGEKKRDYWARVKANKLALYVKLWDMAHNSSEERLAALPKDEQDYLRRKYGEAREFFAADGGLLPVIDGWKFGAAHVMLSWVGYGDNEAWRYIMQAEKQGLITIGFDHIIRLV